MKKIKLNGKTYLFTTCSKEDCDNGNACSMCAFGKPDIKDCDSVGDCRGGYWIEE